MENATNAGPPPGPIPFLSRPRIRLALALGVIAALLYTFWPRANPFPFNLEITMRSSLSGFAQLYYDTGSGVNERNSSRLPVAGGNQPTQYQFPLPEGPFSNFRFDPTDRARNSMALANARIVDRAGNLVRALAPGQFKPGQQIDGLEASETEVTFTTAATADDPILRLELDEPLLLKSYARPSLRKLVRRFFSAFVLCTALGLLAGPLLLSRVKPITSRLSGQAAAWARRHPGQLLLVAAAVSVILSCYPVVFFGRSFLSPNNHSHTYLLYGEMPTVPGYKAVATDDEKGSDLGASMWYSWPTSVVQSRALFQHFELPLWNRYVSGGLPLLGQGQSMFGDPLHFLVLFSNGSSGFWDLKYILAKFLFAACLAFSVLQLTKHQPAALIIALTAPFIGFFSYRYSHPAYFSLCYAPFILLCWFKFMDAPKGRPSAFWLGLMVLANWMVINSGTVKEAYILLLAMNLCGLLTLLLARSVVGKVGKVCQALSAQILFVLISTPIWLSFLMTLRNSSTVYAVGASFQIQPSLLIGLFDDIFYRQFNVGELHFNPSANFLILAGVLWFCFGSSRSSSERLSHGAVLTVLFALAFVFGIVPSSWITQLPFLGNIYHIDNTFSCVAIVPLFLLAGFGISNFWADCLSGSFRNSYPRVLAVLAVLLALYFGTTQAAQRSSRTLLSVGESIPKSSFFWGYSLLLVMALVVIPWLAYLVIKAKRVRTWQALSLVALFILFHWRSGMHIETPFDAYVMNPQPRVDLIATSSPALQFIHGAAGEPSRTAGLGYALAPGYGGAVGVELIDSAEPLLNRYYKSLIDLSGAALIFASQNSAVIEEQLDKDLPLFNMLNVRYYLGQAETRADTIPSLKKVAALDLNIYESSQFWPRAFFSNRVSAYGAESDFVQLVKQGDGRPFAAIAQNDLGQRKDIALPADAAISGDRQIIPATDYTLTTNKTSFRIAAPAEGVVVLNEPYVADDFQLKVNGEPASYFRINSAFRGVFLPKAGDYHFSFAYWPRYLTISLWIAAFGIVLLSLWLGSVFKFSRPAG